MDRLSGIKITKVELKKEGTGQYGDWKLYRIEINDPDWKSHHFSYFAGGDKKPELKVGQELDFIEFETKQDGQYTNFTIDKVGVKEDKPKPPAMSTEGKPNDFRKADNPRSMYYAYAKDIVVAAYTGATIDNPEKIMALIAYMAETMHKASAGDAKTLARLREVYKGLRAGNTESGSSSTSDPREPDQKEGFNPQKWVAEEALHCAEIDNLTHLKNWWTKICKAPEKTLAEEAGTWDGIIEAHAERKKQLTEQFKKEKEAEEAGTGPQEEEEIPF